MVKKYLFSIILICINILNANHDLIGEKQYQIDLEIAIANASFEIYSHNFDRNQYYDDYMASVLKITQLIAERDALVRS